MDKSKTFRIVNQGSITRFGLGLFLAAAVAAGGRGASLGLPATGLAANNAPAGLCDEIAAEEDRAQRMEESIESFHKIQLEEATIRLDKAKLNAAGGSGEPPEVQEARSILAAKERELAVARTELAEVQARLEQIPKVEARLAELKRQRDLKQAEHDRAQEIKRRLDDDPEVKRLRNRIKELEDSLAADIGADSKMDTAELKRILVNQDYKGEQRDLRPPRLYALHRNLERQEEAANREGAIEIRRQIAELRSDLQKRVAELEGARRDLLSAERDAFERLIEEERKLLGKIKDYEQAHAAVLGAEAELHSLKGRQRGDIAWAENRRERIADLEREVPVARQALAAAERSASGPQKELKDATAAFERAARRLAGARADLERQKRLVEELKSKKAQLREAVRSYVSQGGAHGSAAQSENVAGNKQTCLQNLTKAREAFEAAAALWRTSGCRDEALDRAIQGGLDQVYAYKCRGEGLGERPPDGLVPVPGVINEDKDRALQILRQAGLEPVAIEYMKPSRPEMQHKVSSQDPPPGSRTRPRGPVSVFYFGDYTGDDSGGGFKDLGPSTDKSSSTTTSAAPSDPNNPHVQRVVAAIGACDFNRARASLDQYEPANPNDPWMAAKYKEVFEAQDRVEAARGMLLEAQGLLQQPEPSPADIAKAVALIKQARTTAPPCLSQVISRLTPLANSAVTAAEQRRRERDQASRAEAGEALGTLLTGIAGVISQATGGSQTTPPVTGGGRQAGDCGGCAITGLGQGLPVNYLFARTHTTNGCTVTMYTILSVEPRQGDDGRPLYSFSRAEEAQIAAAYGSKVCGPCGSYAQAQAAARSRCPNPRVQNVFR